MSNRDFSEADDSLTRDGASPLPQLPGYHVSAKIGEGGMGTVWRCRQLATHREVALKLLVAGSLASDRSKRRFEREVELAARLEHPGVARVFEAGQHRGVHYYTMELIDGLPLDAYIRDAGLKLPAIVGLLQRVCEAVRHAHQRGVIHRDLKPANILISPDGSPHVLDFGLAKTMLDDEDPAWSVTNPGFAAGTPAYMSPEQAAGESHKVDTRTDVYTLGVILYRALTNEHPHDLSGSRFDIMRRIVDTEVRRPRRVRKDIDADLEAILLKALARDVKERYSTAGDLADDLARYLRGDAVLARPMTLRYVLIKQARKHRNAIALTAAVLGILIGVAVYAFVNIAYERNESKRLLGINEKILKDLEVSQQHAQQQLATSKLSEGSALALAVPPDWKGAIERYHESTAIKNALGEPATEQTFALWAAYRASPPSSHTILLPGDPAGVEPLDDGRCALIAIGPDLFVYDAATGLVRSRLIGQGQPITRIAITGDGSVAAAGDRAGAVTLWNLSDGSRIKTITDHQSAITALLFVAADRGLLSSTARGPIHRHDTRTGQRVASAEMAVVHEDHGIEINHIAPFPVNPKRPEEALVLINAASNRGEVWDVQLKKMQNRYLPGIYGHGVTQGLVSRDGQSFFLPEYDRVNMRRIKDSQVEHAFVGQAGKITAAALGPGDEHFITGGADNMVRVWDARWKEADQVYTEHTAPIRGVCALKLKGRSLPVVVSVSDDRTCKVWTFNELERLFSVHPDQMNIARFSRDGRMVLVVGSEDGQPVLMDVVTGQPLQTFRRSSRSILAAALSPDGTMAAFAGNHGLLQVWDVATGDLIQTPQGHPGHVEVIEYSADGKTVVTGDQDGHMRTWTVTAQGKWEGQYAGRSRPAADAPPGTPPGTPPPCVMKMVFLPTGFAAGLADGRVLHLDRQLKLLSEVRSQAAHVRAMALCPDGYRLLVGGHDPDTTLRMWDTRVANPGDPWKPLHTFAGHFRGIFSIAVSPDGRYAYSGDQDTLMILWDLEQRRRVRSFRHHGSGYSEMQVRWDVGPSWGVGGDGGGDGGGREGGMDRGSGGHDGAIKLLLTGPLGGSVSRWSFGTPARMTQTPLAALERLKVDALDAAALKQLGLWHLERGLRHWGIALLDEARKAGAKVDPMVMAQARWHVDITDARGALEDLKSVPPASGAEEFYVKLLRASLIRAIATPSSDPK